MKILISALLTVWLLAIATGCMQTPIVPGVIDQSDVIYQTANEFAEALVSERVSSSESDPLLAIAFENEIPVERQTYARKIFEAERLGFEPLFSYKYMKLSVAKRLYSNKDFNFSAEVKKIEKTSGGFVHTINPYIYAKSDVKMQGWEEYAACVAMSTRYCYSWPPGPLRVACLGGVAAYCLRSA
jgi:hypothetical protein